MEEVQRAAMEVAIAASDAQWSKIQDLSENDQELNSSFIRHSSRMRTASSHSTLSSDSIAGAWVLPPYVS